MKAVSYSPASNPGLKGSVHDLSFLLRSTNCTQSTTKASWRVLLPHLAHVSLGIELPGRVTNGYKGQAGASLCINRSGRRHWSVFLTLHLRWSWPGETMEAKDLRLRRVLGASPDGCCCSLFSGLSSGSREHTRPGWKMSGTSVLVRPSTMVSSPLARTRQTCGTAASTVKVALRS